MSLKPLVKSVGGKRRLADKILSYMPQQPFTGYWEPFFGGGALFCAAYNAGLINNQTQIILSDNNRAIAQMLLDVSVNTEMVIRELKELDQMYRGQETFLGSDTYYKVRTAWNAGDTSTAKFMFLKATSYNGLWRENKSGQMNAPWGKYAKPIICDEKNILEWGRALNSFDDVTILHRNALDGQLVSLGHTLDNRVVVFFDPPYVGKFSSYTGEGFSLENQAELGVAAAKLSKNGAWVGITNSLESKDLLTSIWGDCKVVEMASSQSINSDGEGRSPVTELLYYKYGAESSNGRIQGS